MFESLASAEVNEHLMHAVLYAALFFETSGDDECDPDHAVKQLEQIAWSLRQLSHEEQELFRTFAEREAATDADTIIAAQLRSLSASLLGDD